MKLDVRGTTLERGIATALVSEVLVDGSRCDAVILADEEAGYVVKLIKPEPATERVEGHVQIVFRDRADRNLPWWLLNDLTAERAGYETYVLRNGRVIVTKEIDIGAAA